MVLADILVGAYKGKYLWYTAPDFVISWCRNPRR